MLVYQRVSGVGEPCKCLCRALFCVPYAVDSKVSIATDRLDPHVQENMYQKLNEGGSKIQRSEGILYSTIHVRAIQFRPKCSI